MLKIKSSDSIVDIINKINNSREDDIVLEFPFGHPVIHNYLSLKILKNEAGSKDLLIITNDLSSKKIGKRLGIKYSIIGNAKFIKEKNLLKHNFTFFEYLKYELKKYFREIKNLIFLNKKIGDYKKRYSYKSGIGFFLLGLIVSIFIFIFIFYLAVNKTYIYITPEISIKHKSRNFIFKENLDEQIIGEKRTIKLKKISENIYLEEIFQTTGIKENEVKKSSGEVLFINTTPEKISLFPNTRLKTKNGIIFETSGWINIPKAELKNDGKIIRGTTKALIKAKIYDEIGEIIGSKGNIKIGTILSLPGLTKNKNRIYAKTTKDFTGGESKIERILSIDDIKKATKIVEERLKRTALKKIKNIVKKMNEIDNTDYDIFIINEAIKYSDLSIEPFGNIKLQDKLDKFKLIGKMNISVFLYDKQVIVSKLKNAVRNFILEGIERINFIDADSLRISNIMSKKESPLEIKATVEIKTFISYNFLTKDDGYIEKLKFNILGLDISEAKKILINSPKISDVTIENRPFFIKKVSFIAENIIFKIKE